MADNPGEPHLLAALSKIAPYMPGAAGALLSMAFGEKLTLHAKVMSLAVGISAVLWLAPALADGFLWFTGQKAPASIIALLGFSCGFFGMALFGGLAQALAKYAKDPLKLVKFEVGGLKVGGGGED